MSDYSWKSAFEKLKANDPFVEAMAQAASGVDSKLYAWLKRVEQWHGTQPPQIKPAKFSLIGTDPEDPFAAVDFGYNPSGLPSWHKIGCFCDTCEHIIARYIGATKDFPPPTLPGLVIEVGYNPVAMIKEVFYRYGKGMHGFKWGVAVAEEFFAQHSEQFLPPLMIEQAKQQGSTVWNNMIAAYDQLSGKMQPAKQGYGNSGTLLKQAVPTLRTARAPCPAPDCPAADKSCDIESLIIHLNDGHKWARAASEAAEGEPNIADWLEEWALLNDVDLTFKVPEEKEIAS